MCYTLVDGQSKNKSKFEAIFFNCNLYFIKYYYLTKHIHPYTYIHMYVYIMHVCSFIYIYKHECVYICTHTQKERQRKRAYKPKHSPNISCL